MRIRYCVCFLLGSLIPVQDHGCQKSQTPLAADAGPSSKTADARLDANHLHVGLHDSDDHGERK
jgi:hypothetical protein